MSKSTKTHSFFYNKDDNYLVDLSAEEKYITSSTKHYAMRYYKEDLRIKSVILLDVKKKWGYNFLTSIVVRRFADLPRLSVNDVEDIRTMIKNRVEDIQLGVESYQKPLNLTKPTMFFEGIDQRIPFKMTATHKEVVYLNQHNIKSYVKLSEVKKFSNGTLVKIQENWIDMLSKNKMGSGNKRRLEEYVRGRPKIVNTCTFRIKMRALLIQHGCEAALEVLPVDMEAQAKVELNKKAHNAVILCLVIGNKFYQKKKLYAFYMSAGQKISKHIDEFSKIVLDLANIKVKFEDEDLALLLLTSLPVSYKHFVDTLIYGREALTLKDVMATLNSKEIKEKSKAKGDNGEGLYVRGRTDHRDSWAVYNWVTTRSVRSKSGKVKVINGSRVILSGIRRDNNVYSLDGHAMAGAGKARTVWQEKSRFKHEAFGKFKEWKKLVENQTGRTVKKLRTYNGLEFCNREFEQLCIESRIARHLIVARTLDCQDLLDGSDMNVVFNESVMYKDTLKDSGACVDKFVEELQLTRDREPRTRTKPLRFQDESNMVAYAFVTAEKEDTHEPLSYKEALTCKDSSKCKAAIKEDMDSLRKNKTWELVDHPAGQKLVSYKRLFKIKEWNKGAKKPRYKARLMAC
nr:retrovirus-related Pol polyprotein from transposon TNT 1-94 [Tanacetum cinerariifolium]